MLADRRSSKRVARTRRRLLGAPTHRKLDLETAVKTGTRNLKLQTALLRKPLICVGLLIVLLAPAAAQQSPPLPSDGLSLTEQVVQQVLEPLKTGLQTQDIQMVMSLFDKKEQTGYSDLQGQLQAFYQVFDQVNFRYQLLQATAEKGRGSATVDMQMDALPYEPTHIPERRSVQMRLQLKLGSKGWKIAGFTPPDFFNVDYRPR